MSRTALYVGIGVELPDRVGGGLGIVIAVKEGYVEVVREGDGTRFDLANEDCGFLSSEWLKWPTVTESEVRRELIEIFIRMYPDKVFTDLDDRGKAWHLRLLSRICADHDYLPKLPDHSTRDRAFFYGHQLRYPLSTTTPLGLRRPHRLDTDKSVSLIGIAAARVALRISRGFIRKQARKCDFWIGMADLVAKIGKTTVHGLLVLLQRARRCDTILHMLWSIFEQEHLAHEIVACLATGDVQVVPIWHKDTFILRGPSDAKITFSKKLADTHAILPGHGAVNIRSLLLDNGTEVKIPKPGPEAGKLLHEHWATASYITTEHPAPQPYRWYRMAKAGRAARNESHRARQREHDSLKNTRDSLLQLPAENPEKAAALAAAEAAFKAHCDEENMQVDLTVNGRSITVVPVYHAIHKAVAEAETHALHNCCHGLISRRSAAAMLSSLPLRWADELLKPAVHFGTRVMVNEDMLALFAELCSKTGYSGDLIVANRLVRLIHKTPAFRAMLRVVVCNPLKTEGTTLLSNGWHDPLRQRSQYRNIFAAFDRRSMLAYDTDPEANARADYSAQHNLCKPARRLLADHCVDNDKRLLPASHFVSFSKALLIQHCGGYSDGLYISELPRESPHRATIGYCSACGLFCATLQKHGAEKVCRPCQAGSTRFPTIFPWIEGDHPHRMYDNLYDEDEVAYRIPRACSLLEFFERLAATLSVDPEWLKTLAMLTMGAISKWHRRLHMRWRLALARNDAEVFKWIYLPSHVKTPRPQLAGCPKRYDFVKAYLTTFRGYGRVANCMMPSTGTEDYDVTMQMWHLDDAKRRTAWYHDALIDPVLGPALEATNQYPSWLWN